MLTLVLSGATELSDSVVVRACTVDSSSSFDLADRLFGAKPAASLAIVPVQPVCKKNKIMVIYPSVEERLSNQNYRRALTAKDIHRIDFMAELRALDVRYDWCSPEGWERWQHAWKGCDEEKKKYYYGLGELARSQVVGKLAGQPKQKVIQSQLWKCLVYIYIYLFFFEYT